MSGWGEGEIAPLVRAMRGEVAENRIDFLFTGAGFWKLPIGEVADTMTWPWPQWCCRTRPWDRERDGD